MPLKGERKKLEDRGKSLAQGRTGLKNGIPARVFVAWDERKRQTRLPRFFEADRATHCGTSTAGRFCWTLTGV
jgi:hypothetical protein